MTTPGSTYRLQLHAGFTLRDAADLTPYLARLGVTHVYLSPILRSAPGSTHGYDVTDPTALDDERGGEAGLSALLSACHAHGLGVVLDIVPNHMDVASGANPWWRSVLRLGPASPHAAVFDIDWDSPAAEGKVIMPVLGAPLTDEIDTGDLRLARDAGRVEVHYHEHRFPLTPATVREIIEAAAKNAEPARGSRVEHAAESAADAERAAHERPRDAAIEGLVRRAEAALADATESDAAFAEAIDAELARRSDPAHIADTLAAQPYRLTYWREGAARLNYRRFFNINDLAAVRAGEAEVFDATHALIGDLARRPGVDGLRVDHPDGLRDPRMYFQRLAALAPGSWIVAEKILEGDEQLPEDWPVAGTTGYDFLNEALGVLIDAEGETALTAAYAARLGGAEPFEETAFEAKSHAARSLLGADLERLVRLVTSAGLLGHASEQPDTATVREAIALLAACTPVYRTYVVPGSARDAISNADRAVVAESLERVRARAASPDVARVAESLAALITDTPPNHAQAADFVARFQQFTAPAMAKGVEDTAFYRDARLIALNEVGGDPARFGLSAEAFHDRCARRAARHPAAMITTDTHDAKRSEDVRARLAVLSEIPVEWDEASRGWIDNHRRRTGDLADDIGPAMVEMFHQTLVGAWPGQAESRDPAWPGRVWGFMLKAAREAKENTSWKRQDEDYEAGLERFVRTALADEAFSASVAAFARRVLLPGRIKSIAQTLLRLACPGVPDTYQGCELWALHLVDPDNRRPVDYALRARLLEDALAMPPERAWATLDDADDPGSAKLLTLRRALAARAALPGAFGPGGVYRGLETSGPGLLGLAREDRLGVRACVVVPRLTTADAKGLGSVVLPRPADDGQWINALDGTRPGPASAGGRVGAAALFALAPAALLVDERTAEEIMR